MIVRDGALVLRKLPLNPVTLGYMQDIVQGNIELVDRITVTGVEVDVWGNDEAKVIGMPLNVFRRDGEPLCGPLLVLAGTRDGDSVPLTLKEAQRISLIQVGQMAPLLIVEDDVCG